MADITPPTHHGVIENTPENINPLQDNKFQFIVKKLPGVKYFCTEANIPTLTIDVTSQPNPLINVHWPETKLSYGDLSIGFNVDEDLQNYLEIHNWMVGMGFPDDTSQYKDLLEDQDNIFNPAFKGRPFSDATLIIYSSHFNHNFEITFIDLFPTTLSGLTFQTDVDTVSVIKGTADFKYRKFEIVNIG